MQKWIDLLNSMGIDFDLCIPYENKAYISIWGYDLNTVKCERIIKSKCVHHGSWLAQGQEIYTMADGTEITFIL